MFLICGRYFVATKTSSVRLVPYQYMLAMLSVGSLLYYLPTLFFFRVHLDADGVYCVRRTRLGDRSGRVVTVLSQAVRIALTALVLPLITWLTTRKLKDGLKRCAKIRCSSKNMLFCFLSFSYMAFFLNYQTFFFCLSRNRSINIEYEKII